MVKGCLYNFSSFKVWRSDYNSTHQEISLANCSDCDSVVSWLYPCSNSIQPSLSIDRLCVNINRFVLLLIQPYLGLSAIARRSCQNYYRPGVVRGANRGNIKMKLSTTVTPPCTPPPFASVRKSAFVFPSERTSCLNLLSPNFPRH